MNEKQSSNPKLIRSFWPLVIIFTIAALFAGLILGAAYSNELQDEIASFQFAKHSSEATKESKLQTTSTPKTIFKTPVKK